MKSTYKGLIIASALLTTISALGSEQNISNEKKIVISKEIKDLVKKRNGKALELDTDNKIELKVDSISVKVDVNMIEELIDYGLIESDHIARNGTMCERG